jgi:serine/threonine protein kinase/DNA-directed RNA polymerase specialized sigma24 family protein
MNPESSPLSLEMRVDEACDRFEAAWKGSHRPRIEDYLACFPEPERLALLRALLALEIELRCQSGDQPALGEYEERFPGREALIRAAFAEARPAEYDSAGVAEPSTGPLMPFDESSEGDASTRPPAESSPLLPDRFGRYKVCGKLGGGTFGNVYLANDSVMDRQVAIKVPSARLLASQSAKDQFLSEARSVARLQHEGIVRAYDFGQEVDGTCYIVYEFIEGTNLKERITAEPLGPDEAARILAQLAEALHYAHLQGLVHRDIKPANILLDRQGRPRLTDFGLAVREEDLPKERGRLAGTRHYMSPEQVRREGHHIDGRTDIYSLGVVLYELLCGRRPFEAKTVRELEDQILHRQAKPPRQIKDSIPQELERICLKALSKRINDRYTTGKDMAEELRRVLGPVTTGQMGTQPQKAGFEGDGIRLAGLTFNQICEKPQGLIGSQVGPYVIKEFVGRGGTGIVYRAQSTRTGQDVCLKIFYPIPASVHSDVISRAISRWVRGLTALNHANVVKPLDFGRLHVEDDVSFFVATEFIQGTPLDAWISNPPKGPFAAAARMRIALDLTKALQAAHNCTYIDETGFECRGVLHGDIKPANVIVRPDNSAVIVDFMMVDIQRVISQHATSDRSPLVDTTLFGTRGFMAPEQASDGIVTVKTDVFALGKTLGLLFFPSQDVHDAPTGGHNYPEGLRALLRAMVNVDPSQRPPDMATVARRLTAPSLDQNVQFSVYRPKTIRPQEWYTLLAFAHLSERPATAPENEPDPVQEVQRQARQILGANMEKYGNITKESEHPVARQGGLTFVPEVAGIEFNPPSRSFVWEEIVHREEFRLRASQELDGQTAKGRMTVFLGGIILAEVSLSIRVDSGYKAATGTEPKEMDCGRPYRKIFASYSGKDSWVVEEFKRYAQALGDKYVRKHTRLRAGEEWSGRLKELIEEADIFQLFWSSNSMHSPFVQREWECALALRRPNFIRPCYWENPLPTCAEKNLPPEELRRVHFQRIPVALPTESGRHDALRTQAGGPIPQPKDPGHTTSLSLLDRVRANESSAWEHFVNLYTPLLDRWCQQYGLQEADTANIRQEVFLAVARHIGEYQREGGSFRHWLWLITHNKVADLFRSEAGQAAAGGSDAWTKLQQISSPDLEDSAFGEENAPRSADNEKTPVTPHEGFGSSAESASPPITLGEYVIDRGIGQGGFGTVYLGHSANDPRHLVAIKVVRASAHASELLLREFRRIAQLRHPGIVKVADAGVQGGWVYFVTDYVKGQTLQAQLTEHPPTWEEAARIIAAIAEALHYVHANGVVHRDVKPSHILLTQNNEPILVGFGLATSMSEEDMPELGAIVGTPAYMAPEQILGQRVDGRADLYSLGVVLYRMLCGRHPFSDTGVWERLRRVREEEPTPPRQVISEIPRDLEGICLKAMAKRVTDRYTTGADLAADLRRFLAGFSVAAAIRSARPPASVGRSSWKRTLMLVALAILAGLLWLILH